MTVLLDTTVLVDCLQGRKRRPQLLDTLASEGGDVATSVISVAEVFQGMNPAHEATALALFAGLRIIDLSFPIAKLGGRLSFEWARKGRTVSLADALIAATAIHLRMPLATDNRKDFPSPELKLYPLPE